MTDLMLFIWAIGWMFTCGVVFSFIFQLQTTVFVRILLMLLLFCVTPPVWPWLLGIAWWEKQ